MKEKPWYICLSLLAFFALWMDTARRFVLMKKLLKQSGTLWEEKMGLWMSAVWNIFKLFLFYFIIPASLLSLYSYSVSFPSSSSLAITCPIPL